jgi:hypothetical protein
MLKLIRSSLDAAVDWLAFVTLPAVVQSEFHVGVSHGSPKVCGQVTARLLIIRDVIAGELSGMEAASTLLVRVEIVDVPADRKMESDSLMALGQFFDSKPHHDLAVDEFHRLGAC